LKKRRAMMDEEGDEQPIGEMAKESMLLISSSEGGYSGTGEVYYEQDEQERYS
jgi:hypothetical protein